MKVKRTRDGMRTEYDLSTGVRGKYYRAYWQGKSVVELEPDVAAHFKTSKAVNDALRAMLRSGK
jgi:hypothetical protein